MPPTITPPVSSTALIELLNESGIHPAESLEERLSGIISELPTEPLRAAEVLVRRGVITPFQAKQLLAGRNKGFRLGAYVIQDMLGQGGMGSVYLAEHETLRRRVALKVLRSQKGQDTKVSVERFLREARAAAALDHPNIVRIHDVAQQGDVYYLVMEYVEGLPLDRILANGGAIAPSRAVGYIAQAAAGLQHAHEKGFVHRDIKPANLILGSDGTIKILDMGLARSTDATDNLTEMLDKGAIVGTADYISPEQALGDGPVDVRADLYSLGATFYALVTGKPPFKGTTSQKLAQHQLKEAPDLAEQDRTFPPELALVIAKLLAKKPKDRYQTPADLIAALAPWLSDDGEQKVVMGLSGIEGDSSGKLRETIASKRMKRTTSTRLPQTAELIETEESPKPSEQTAKTRRKKKQEVEQNRRRQIMMIGGGVLGLLLVGLVAYAAWPSSKPKKEWPDEPPAVVQTPTPSPTPKNNPSPQNNNPSPPPKKDNNPPVVQQPPKQGPINPGTAKVAINTTADGIHIKTAKYEATLEKADGCLSSFRVAGTEFLRSGAPLPGGRTTSRGAYFFSEKNGHEGLVKLPDIRQTTPTTFVANGGSFSVTYEFNPNSLTVTASNSTDESVPYHILFDTNQVHDVANDKGDLLAIPPQKTLAEKMEPKWRTSTWYAGRARVKVSEQVENSSTRVWGPFSNVQAQTWVSSVKSYNRVQFTMEPSIVEESNPSLSPDGVQITRIANMRRVRTELYEATVRDGWMPSLRIDGVEVLKSNISVARGIYFNTGISLPFEVKQSGNTVTATCDKASIQYDFAATKFTLTAQNRTDKALQLYVVLDTCVTVVQSEKSEWSRVPLGKSMNTPGSENWKNTTWYAGRAKFKLTGASRLWGPWQGKYQVWEISIDPNEKRSATAEIGLTDAAEAAKIGEITGVKPALSTPLTLESPSDYQVFQRDTKVRGDIVIRGRVRTAYDKLEVRITGKSLQGMLPDKWSELTGVEKNGRLFEASVSTPAGGWYKVEVRARKGGETVGQMTIDHVGVGEVFVGAGQSNSTNGAQERILQKSGMVSSFSGTGWQLADDPQPGVHDNSAGGSFWPAFGDAMYDEYQVPIGIASTGHSGSSVNQWLPDTELFRWTNTRMRQLGPRGFRAVLWHQGESDIATSSEEYARKMTAIIRESQKSAGWEVPWFVALVSYQNPNQVSSPSPREAQKKLWQMGIAMEGPDTDTLTGDHRDNSGKGLHFSPKGLQAHGRMWAQKVSVYLDKELAK